MGCVMVDRTVSAVSVQGSLHAQCLPLVCSVHQMVVYTCPLILSVHRHMVRQLLGSLQRYGGY